MDYSTILEEFDPLGTSAAGVDPRRKRSIYVENAPISWMTEIKRYLENPDNGGGEITDIQAVNNRVRVTFSDAQGLQ